MLSKRTMIAFTAIMTMSATVLLAQDGGDVIVKKQEGINFLSLLFKGGWFMVPLGLLSIAVVTISIERFIMLRRKRLFPEELVTHIGMLAQAPGGLDPLEAYKLCQIHPSAASKIIRNTLVKVGRPHSEVENALKESAQREATRLSQLASWLSLAAAVAPLIGLLGTVWGITQAFYDTTNLGTDDSARSRRPGTRGIAANGQYFCLSGHSIASYGDQKPVTSVPSKWRVKNFCKAGLPRERSTIK